MATIKNRLSRIPRFVWWLTGFLVLYAALGFLLVPWLAERQLKSILDERLELAAEVEKIAFNPFTMVAQVDGFSAVHSDGTPLLQLQSLHANFQPTRLVLLRFQFSELQVSDLDLTVQRDASGLDTFTRLAQTWEATTAPVDTAAESTSDEASDDGSGLIPIVAEAINLANLNFHVLDEVPATPFETSLRLAEVDIGNLSTLPESRGPKSLVLEFEGGARLTVSGDHSLNPPELVGSLELESFPLETVSRYLQDTLPLRVDNGRLRASVQYDVRLLDQGPSLALSQIQVAIEELSATQDQVDQPFLTAARLQASNGTLSYPENQFELETLQLDQIQLSATREAGEPTNLEQLIAAFSDTGAADPATVPVEPEQAGTPWNVTLQRLALTDNRITFSDRNPEIPADLGIDLNIEITDIDNQPDSSFPLTLNLALDSGGQLQVDGEISVLPDPAVATEVALSGLDLTVLQPYVNEFAFIDLESGQLALQAELITNATEPFAYAGNLRLLDLSLADQQQSENLFSMGALTIDGIAISLAESSVDVSEILFDSLFARVVVNEDGTTNIGRSIKPTAPGSDRAPPSTTDAESDAGLPFAITVGRIQVENGASDFTDLNLPITFDANIKELAGTVEGFAAPSAQPLELSLEGTVDEFGLVQLDSAFDPFDILSQSRVDLQFRNLEMPAMTPYTIKFAGREIANGSMDVNLSYNIEASQLAANNQVVLRDLQLGERVEYPDAMDLPLDMATALLKDVNGVIDLEVPVTGDVNDPDFNLGPAIRRAITNVLVNLVTAPFRLLGSLIGGDAADIDSIRFQPGRTEVSPPEQQVLQQLFEALSQRPQLILEIPLIASEADRLALQTSVVTERINSRIELLSEDAGSLTERRLTVLEALYTESGLNPSLDDLKLTNTVETSTPNPLTGEPLISQELDIQAYVDDVRNRLIADEPISEQQLASLADSRLTAVQEYLATLGALSESQVRAGESQNPELDDDGWLEMEFGLSSR